MLLDMEPWPQFDEAVWQWLSGMARWSGIQQRSASLLDGVMGVYKVQQEHDKVQRVLERLQELGMGMVGIDMRLVQELELEQEQLEVLEGT